MGTPASQTTLTKTQQKILNDTISNIITHNLEVDAALAKAGSDEGFDELKAAAKGGHKGAQIFVTGINKALNQRASWLNKRSPLGMSNGKMVTLGAIVLGGGLLAWRLSK